MHTFQTTVPVTPGPDDKCGGCAYLRRYSLFSTCTLFPTRDKSERNVGGEWGYPKRCAQCLAAEKATKEHP